MRRKGLILMLMLAAALVAGCRIEPPLHLRKAVATKVIVETIRKIESGVAQALPQDELLDNQPLKPAPKITKEFCNVDWSRDCLTVYNHIRGLSPYPAAHTQLQSENGAVIDLKIYAAKIETCIPDVAPGMAITDNKKYLKISLSDGFLFLTQVQQAGKKEKNKWILPIFHFFCKKKAHFFQKKLALFKNALFLSCKSLTTNFN